MEKFFQRIVAKRQTSLKERVAKATKQAPLTTRIRQVETERLIADRFVVYQSTK